MERWDFDCQKCGRNIGDYAYVDAEWYQCSQDRHRDKIFGEACLHTTVSIISGKLILEDADSLSDELRLSLLYHLKEILSDDHYQQLYGKITTDEEPEKIVGVVIHESHSETTEEERKKKILRKNLLIWYEKGKKEEYEQKAGLVKHKVKGSGWGRLGYAFDVKCAKKLKFKCDVCGNTLEKVVADQHPGGQWGIRGGRGPAPM